MIIDFTKITIYEILALLLSLIAILVPSFKWLWRTLFVKAKLKFIPNGKIILFFNKSGAYIRIDGAYEALNKSVTIKNGKVRITREDNTVLKQDWSVFISPVWQNFSGSIASSNEYAHPFRLEANSLICAFVEYADPFNKGNILWQKIENKLNSIALELKKEYGSFDEALRAFKTSPDFTQAYRDLQATFFWQAGKYNLSIGNQYETEKANFEYSFTLQQYDVDKLNGNIEKVLVSILAEKYNIPIGCETPAVDLLEK